MTSVDRAIDLPVETAAPRPWAVPFVFRQRYVRAVPTVRQVNESEIETPSPLRTPWIANGGMKRPVPGSMTNVSIRSSPSSGRR